MKLVTTADGSKTLFSKEYKQTFHSDKGALAEAKHVFLQTSGIAQRLRDGQASRVLEVGFGTGFNFFLTADLALQHNTSLDYVALEQNLLDSQTIASLAYSEYLVNKNLLTSFLEYRQNIRGLFEFEGLRLELKLGNALNQRLPANYFDAIYQDAFSPDENSELWTSEFLAKLQKSLKPGGKLTTYSVKGEIRRKLRALGFEVKKLPGPKNGKREILLARLV